MKKYVDGFKTYLVEKKGLMPNSVQSYMRDIQMFDEYLHSEGIEGLDGVNQTTVMSYMYRQLQNGRSAASLSRALASIRALYTYLITIGAAKDNIAVGIKAPKGALISKASINSDDVNSILGVIPNDIRGRRDRAMFELVCDTGIRASALTELTLDDIELEYRAININGGIVELNKKVSECLRKYVEGPRVMLLKGKECKILFPNCNGGKMTRQGFWKNIKKYAVLVGLEDKLSPRTLRGVGVE